MIFVTVGAQMAFDRLIGAVDAWAGERDRNDVFAQIGPSELTPSHMQWTNFLDPPAFRKRVQEADAIVAHAGMGSILTALEVGKPILVMPRLGRLRETRNDHQVATAERFLEMGRVAVAMDETELPSALDRLSALECGERISRWASPELLGALRAFIVGDAGGEPAERPELARESSAIAPGVRQRESS
ncbi:MAG: glycosyltransferase [Phycisphaerales bacterium]